MTGSPEEEAPDRAPQPRVALPGAPVPPLALEFLGVRVHCVVPASETDGAWTLLEYAVPPHFPGPPAHFHRRTTELFYVVRGKLTLETDGQTREIGTGELVPVTPGVVHRFSNPGPRPCRFRVQISPPGLESYFDELARLLHSAPRWPLTDLQPLFALAERYDIFAAPHP